jgi:hypothetical protein
MSPCATNLDRYLTIRRSLGYHLGTAARILADSSPSRKRSTPRP